MNTLHIVDGESTGGTLKQSGVARAKNILGWRDALYTGPVPAGLTLRQLSRLRSRFWTKGRKSDAFLKRDATLAKLEHYDEVALWFGPGCALCHLSLAQILSWLSEHRISAKRLSWVALHGGMIRPDQMPKAHESGTPITAKQMQLNKRFWRDFRRPSPVGLVQMLRTDLNEISGLRDAVGWLLQEYPSRRNGLSRLQNELLREIRRLGSAKAARAVGWVIARDWVGDSLLFDMLRSFVTAKYPLLKFAEPYAGRLESWKFNGATLALTDIGRRVLANKEDVIALNGIDRWIGGVHLLGHQVRWRWDDKARTLVRTKL